MTPLSASATQTAVNADSDSDAISVPISLDLLFDGVTFDPLDLYAAMARLGGPPVMQGRRQHYRFRWGSGFTHNQGSYPTLQANNASEVRTLLPQPGFEGGVTNYGGSTGTETIASESTNIYKGSTSLKCTVTTAGTQGCKINTAPTPAVGPGARVLAGAFCLGNAGSEAIKARIIERDAADSTTVSTTDANFAALSTSSWTFASVKKDFTTGRLARTHIVTQGAAASEVWYVDQWFCVALDPNIYPTVNVAGGLNVHCDLDFDGAPFTADDIYTALDAVWGTVASDKDTATRHSYQFRITT